MAIFYTMLAVLDKIPYDQHNPASSLSSLHYKMLENLENQQLKLNTKAVNPGKGLCNRQVLHVIENNGDIYTSREHEGEVSVQLPLFTSLADVELYCSALSDKFKSCVSKYQMQSLKRISGITFYPAVIDIPSSLDLPSANSFRYPYVSIDNHSIQGEFSTEGDVVQVIVNFPKVEPEVPIRLLSAKKLNIKNDPLQNNEEPCRILAFKKDNIFYAWDVLTHQNRGTYYNQQEGYGRLWLPQDLFYNPRNPDREAIFYKVLRMFSNYAFPVSHRKASENKTTAFFQAKVENVVATHFLRSHLQLANEVITMLMNKKDESWNANKLIAEVLTVVSEKISDTVHDSHQLESEGSLVHRLNFIITQLSAGTVTNYMNLEQSVFDVQSLAKYSSNKPTQP